MLYAINIDLAFQLAIKIPFWRRGLQGPRQKRREPAEGKSGIQTVDCSCIGTSWLRDCHVSDNSVMIIILSDND